MLRGAWFHDDDDFGPHEHDEDFGDGAGHGELASDDTWDFSKVNLTTVGIDIGSTTAHLLFAHITLQSSPDGSGQRFEVVSRDVLYRSPILLTPSSADGTIDALALGEFVEAQYAAAGLDPAAVDSGAVILTGLALERRNAQAVADVLSAGSGRFVCATAGHRFEALLAAHGSGAVALSAARETPVLHLDIGGGTTKLALIERGQIQQTCAVRIGARLVVLDAEQRVQRVEPAAALLGERLGLDLAPGHMLHEAERAALARLMVDVLLECLRSKPGALARELLLTEPLELNGRSLPAMSFSGGVSEYIAGRTTSRYGDLGLDLARALNDARASGALTAESIELEHGIRATVLGASQFSVQVSGNTISVSSAAILPLRNLPVVAARVDAPWPAPEQVCGAIEQALRRLDLTAHDERTVALSLSWAGDASYRVLLALAQGVHAALPRAGRGESPLVVVVDRDIAGALGSVLAHDLALDGPLVVVDGLDLRELDFVDIGPLVQPANVVPVVVKSLAFV